MRAFKILISALVFYSVGAQAQSVTYGPKVYGAQDESMCVVSAPALNTNSLLGLSGANCSPCVAGTRKTMQVSNGTTFGHDGCQGGDILQFIYM